MYDQTKLGNFATFHQCDFPSKKVCKAPSTVLNSGDWIFATRVPLCVRRCGVVRRKPLSGRSRPGDRWARARRNSVQAFTSAADREGVSPRGVLGQ